jgi:hypothetical protein
MLTKLLKKFWVSGFKFTFPLLTRMFPNLYANTLATIQPMTAPSGNLFYTEHDDGTGSREETEAAD